jgi:hypothetical protein
LRQVRALKYCPSFRYSQFFLQTEQATGLQAALASSKVHPQGLNLIRASLTFICCCSSAFIAKYGQQAYLNRIAAERAREGDAWAAKVAEEEKQRDAERKARREARQRQLEDQSLSATVF